MRLQSFTNKPVKAQNTKGVYDFLQETKKAATGFSTGKNTRRFGILLIDKKIAEVLPAGGCRSQPQVAEAAQYHEQEEKGQHGNQGKPIGLMEILIDMADHLGTDWRDTSTNTMRK